MCGERYIICGDATATMPAECEVDALRLHLYGADDDHKVTLRMDDIRRQMYKDVPTRFRDLLEIATYVFAADQAIGRGARDVETFGCSWRRHLRFMVPVGDVDF